MIFFFYLDDKICFKDTKKKRKNWTSNIFDNHIVDIFINILTPWFMIYNLKQKRIVRKPKHSSAAIGSKIYIYISIKFTMYALLSMNSWKQFKFCTIRLTFSLVNLRKAFFESLLFFLKPCILRIATPTLYFSQVESKVTGM